MLLRACSSDVCENADEKGEHELGTYLPLAEPARTTQVESNQSSTSFQRQTKNMSAYDFTCTSAALEGSPCKKLNNQEK